MTTSVNSTMGAPKPAPVLNVATIGSRKVVSTAMTSRAQLSRVTLVGERRRADIVLPSDTPIGQLLPDILQLLDDRAASRPMTRQLITSDGSALPHDSTLSSAEIADGAVLRLVRAHSAPPPPSCTTSPIWWPTTSTSRRGAGVPPPAGPARAWRPWHSQ